MASQLLVKSQRIGILPQPSGWGTPIAESGNFEKMLVDAPSIKVAPYMQIDNFDYTSGEGLLPETTRIYTDTTSGLSKISYTAPIDKSFLAYHLAAALQKVKEYDSGDYKKEYWHYAETLVPDFTVTSPSAYVNGAFLYTVVAEYGVNSGYGWLLQNAILNSLTLEFDFNANGIARLGKLSAEWVGNVMLSNAALEGTWADKTPAYYNAATGVTLDVAGIATLTGTCVKKYTLTINNNVSVNCKTTGGAAANYIVKPEIMVNVVLPLTSATQVIPDGVIGNLASTFTLSTGTPAADGYLNIVSKGSIMNSDNVGAADDYGELTLNQRVENPGGTGTGLIITMADDVDRGFPTT